MFLIRSRREWLILPEIRSQVRVSLGNSGVSSFCEITKSTGRTTSRSVTVLDTGHVEKLLGYRSRNDAGTSGCWDQTHLNRSALASDLARYGVGLSDLVTPVSTTYRNYGEFSKNNCATNRSRNFFGALDSETDVAIGISDRDECLRRKRTIRQLIVTGSYFFT